MLVMYVKYFGWNRYSVLISYISHVFLHKTKTRHGCWTIFRLSGIDFFWPNYSFNSVNHFIISVYHYTTREKATNDLRNMGLTCSTPSMCASISCMTRVSRSTSSALCRPLLILSANRFMFFWASSRCEWSGWSSGVCFSKS